MDGFAFDDTDSDALFVIDVIVERRAAPSDACFNLERSRFQGELFTGKLDDASAHFQIKRVSAPISRKMGVKVIEH